MKLSKPSRLILVRGEELYTTSLIIAEQFGRRHDNVLQTIRSLLSEETLTLLDLKESQRSSRRGDVLFFELSERAALIAMPFIGGRKSREGQARLVDAFLSVRATLRRQERARSEHNADPIWLKLRLDTKEAFKYVNLVLQETRKLQGKDTETHHYANEARMMNAVLVGVHAPLDRDLLDPHQLKLLEDIQKDNSRMLIQGKTYAERKQALLDRYIPKLEN
jgi:phage regulator Rha-like protein